MYCFGGGLLVYFKSNLNVTFIEANCFEHLEYTVIRFQLNIFIFIYRKPSSSNTFLQTLNLLLQNSIVNT